MEKRAEYIRTEMVYECPYCEKLVNIDCGDTNDLSQCDPEDGTCDGCGKEFLLDDGLQGRVPDGFIYRSAGEDI